jgi:flagellar biosynthetic protein FliP
VIAGLLCVSPAVAQSQSRDSGRIDPVVTSTPVNVPAPVAPPQTVDLANPLSVLQNAATALPTGALPGDPPAARPGLSASLSIILLLTVLSIAPAMLVMCTSFTRVVIVLSLLRQAIGTQSLPPSQVIVGLSLFLTFLIMAPTLERINREAIVPLQANQIDEFVAWERAKQPLRDFMFNQIEHAGNWGDVYMILNYRGIDTSEPDKLTRADVDMLSLIPAFVLSELKVSFLMGFRLYLPFLVIEMVISSILISMGMMMLPPVLISLPFKLLLFVLVDGWQLVAGSILNSFAVPGVTS